jgi:hypothetical protein
MRDYHEDHTLPRGDEVWVFGSNLAGIHGAGAAEVARDRYGYPMGTGIGREGQAYGIPTKDRDLNTRSLADVRVGVERFIRHAKSRPSDYFFVTAIGCGYAGFTPDQIAPLFVNAPANCSFPEPWRPYLDPE